MYQYITFFTASNKNKFNSSIFLKNEYYTGNMHKHTFNSTIICTISSRKLPAQQDKQILARKSSIQKFRRCQKLRNV